MTTIIPRDTTGQAPVAADKQPATIEAAPQAAPSKEEAVKPEDSRLAALARQQVFLRKQQRELEEQKRAFAQERESLKPKLTEAEKYSALVNRLKTDPYGAMLEQGLTADQVAALMLNQPTPEDQKFQAYEMQIRQLQAKLDALESGQSSAEEARLNSARNQILHDVKAFVAQDKSFEAMNLYGDTAAYAVVELIERTFNEEGYVMDTDAAVAAVEEYLTEEALKAASLGKVKAKLTPTQQAAQAQAQGQVAQKTQSPAQPGINTLSNRMVPSASKPLTPRERRERAIAAFQGRLNT